MGCSRALGPELRRWQRPATLESANVVLSGENRPARPAAARPVGRAAGADRTTRRLGGRKAGESAATDLPWSATVVLARSEWQAANVVLSVASGDPSHWRQYISEFF